MNADPPTLFVVDDDPDACRSAAALASSMGLACETYSSAESFLEGFQPGRPGCVLIDLRLNGMSGFDLQEELVARGSKLPVIVISAYADVPATVRLMRAGAMTVLEKPYHADELDSDYNDHEMDDGLRNALGIQCRPDDQWTVGLSGFYAFGDPESDMEILGDQDGDRESWGIQGGVGWQALERTLVAASVDYTDYNLDADVVNLGLGVDEEVDQDGKSWGLHLGVEQAVNMNGGHAFGSPVRRWCAGVVL